MAIIKPKRTATAGKVPTTSDLADGELGINTTSRKTYVRAGVSVVEMTPSDIPINARTSTAGVVNLAAADAGCVAEVDASTTSVVIDVTLFANNDSGLIRTLNATNGATIVSVANGGALRKSGATAKLTRQYALVTWQIKDNSSGASGVAYLNGELAAS